VQRADIPRFVQDRHEHIGVADPPRAPCLQDHTEHVEARTWSSGRSLDLSNLWTVGSAQGRCRCGNRCPHKTPTTCLSGRPSLQPPSLPHPAAGVQARWPHATHGDRRQRSSAPDTTPRSQCAHQHGQRPAVENKTSADRRFRSPRIPINLRGRSRQCWEPLTHPWAVNAMQPRVVLHARAYTACVQHTGWAEGGWRS
jgi:hypothetical protein